MNIIEAIDDPQLLGAAIKDQESFAAWRAALKSFFALPMTDDEEELYRTCTGRTELPTATFGIVWLIVGRRGGKSFTMALIAVYMAVFIDWLPFLSPGERAVVLIVAADREQAKIIRRYVSGIMANPLLSPRIESETADSVELTEGVVIEVAACSYRTVRGRSVCVALLEEAAYWRSDSSANPDREVWRAIRASMASFGSAALAIIASSPYAKKGILWDGHKRYFGTSDARNLVWKAPTKVMNPTISDEFLAEEFEADPISAASEYGSVGEGISFRSDVEDFVSRDVVDACISPGRYELPPISNVRYVGFCDPSGGSQDSMTLAIAHREDDVAVLDAVREVRPPFSPDATVQDFSDLLKAYRIHTVRGDRYAGEWPRERFNVHGIKYEPSEKPKSDLYRDLLPTLNAGRCELLDIPKLASQLCGLERRTARGGRDSIDHAPGMHDDVANAAAGALGLVSNWRNDIVDIWKRCAATA